MTFYRSDHAWFQFTCQYAVLGVGQGYVCGVGRDKADFVTTVSAGSHAERRNQQKEKATTTVATMARARSHLTFPLPGLAGRTVCHVTLFPRPTQATGC